MWNNAIRRSYCLVFNASTVLFAHKITVSPWGERGNVRGGRRTTYDKCITRVTTTDYFDRIEPFVVDYRLFRVTVTRVTVNETKINWLITRPQLNTTGKNGGTFYANRGKTVGALLNTKIISRVVKLRCFLRFGVLFRNHLTC